MLTLMNAEWLAAASLAQMSAPGTSQLYNFLPVFADMRDGAYASGAIEIGMMNSAVCAMARFYNVPAGGYLGLTSSKVIADHAGSLAQVLESISAAGANLEFMIARRAPENPGYSVVFLAPILGDESVKAAEKAKLKKWTTGNTLRVEGPDQPELGARIARTVANTDINMRGASAAKLEDRCVFYLAFDSEADASKARDALTESLG